MRFATLLEDFAAAVQRNDGPGRDNLRHGSKAQRRLEQVRGGAIGAKPSGSRLRKGFTFAFQDQSSVQEGAARRNKSLDVVGKTIKNIRHGIM